MSKEIRKSVESLQSWPRIESIEVEGLEKLMMYGESKAKMKKKASFNLIAEWIVSQSRE